MQLHPNAKLTPKSRRLLVRRVLELNWPVAKAARAGGVSRQTAYKWLNRFKEHGNEGLQDRPSTAKRQPSKTPAKLVQRMVKLRRRGRAAWEIAQELGVPVSTVSKRLKAEGVGKIWRLQEALDPPKRYEHDVPGGLLHIDAKRYAKIQGVGHAIHGNRKRKNRGIGYEVVFVCVDDHTRLAYAEIHPSENARYATLFFQRAIRWFQSLGIEPRRVLSDNAKCYSSNAFTALCQSVGIRQSFTRPYTPRTNGKAERFIQTMKRRWAYRYVFRSSAMRAESLRPWVKHYNHQRPHRSLGKKTPMQRLREYRQRAA
ncbi:MAG: IS481 family transposase [bacterium]|nr:IS481 family transposase [bacterium]